MLSTESTSREPVIKLLEGLRASLPTEIPLGPSTCALAQSSPALPIEQERRYRVDQVLLVDREQKMFSGNRVDAL